MVQTTEVINSWFCKFQRYKIVAVFVKWVQALVANCGWHLVGWRLQVSLSYHGHFVLRMPNWLWHISLRSIRWAPYESSYKGKIILHAPMHLTVVNYCLSWCISRSTYWKFTNVSCFHHEFDCLSQLAMNMDISSLVPNPLRPEIKWWHPGKNQCRCTLRFIVCSYSRNGYSKNFLVYDHDPGGFLVVLLFASSFGWGRWPWS